MKADTSEATAFASPKTKPLPSEDELRVRRAYPACVRYVIV